MPCALRTGKRKIGQERFASAGHHHIKMRSSDEFLKVREFRILREEIIALLLEPQFLELRIVDENGRYVRSVRTVFQILDRKSVV